MISVCLVDDQTLVRQGVRSLLELSDSIRVVAEFGDGEEPSGRSPSSSPTWCCSTCACRGCRGSTC
jgi:DNA-binding NarL/FixJ family response regulator